MSIRDQLRRADRDTHLAAQHHAPMATEAQRLAAEAVGTFGLTFVAAGATVIGAASKGSITMAAAVVAPALVVMGMIYTVGDISGAHFNPTVTLAFAVRRDFPWRRVPGYLAVQLLFASLAALILRLLFGNIGHLGATLPHHGLITSLVMEVILTFFLLTVIFGTAIDHRLVGHNAALAVAGTIAMCGLFAAPISGASMNPARSFGPALVGGHLDTVWIYVLGPLTGGLLAAGLEFLLRGRESISEREAARGPGQALSGSGPAKTEH